MCSCQGREDVGGGVEMIEVFSTVVASVCILCIMVQTAVLSIASSVEQIPFQ